MRRVNKSLQAALEATVWSTGCSSYFMTKDGLNPVNWPWTTVYLRYRLRSFGPNASDFVVTTKSDDGGVSAEGVPSC
jgi:hypothetical protein